MTRRLPKNCFDCNCNIVPPCTPLGIPCCACLDYENAIEFRRVLGTAVDIDGPSSLFRTSYGLGQVQSFPLSLSGTFFSRCDETNGRVANNPIYRGWQTNLRRFSGPHLTYTAQFGTSYFYTVESLRFSVFCPNPADGYLDPFTRVANFEWLVRGAWVFSLNVKCQSVMNQGWLGNFPGTDSGEDTGDFPLDGCILADYLGTLGGYIFYAGVDQTTTTWKYPAHPFDPIACPNDSRIEASICSGVWRYDLPSAPNPPQFPNPSPLSHQNNWYYVPPNITPIRYNFNPPYPEFEPTINVTSSLPYLVFG